MVRQCRTEGNRNRIEAGPRHRYTGPSAGGAEGGSTVGENGIHTAGSGERITPYHPADNFNLFATPCASPRQHRRKDVQPAPSRAVPHLPKLRVPPSQTSGT